MESEKILTSIGDELTSAVHMKVGANGEVEDEADEYDCG